jgi:hypothetical protein
MAHSKILISKLFLSGRAVAVDRTQEPQHDYGPNKSAQHTGQVESGNARVAEGLVYPSACKRTGDADHDVADDASNVLAGHEPTSEGTDDKAEKKPRQYIHLWLSDSLICLAQQIYFVRVTHAERFLVVDDADVSAGTQSAHLIRGFSICGKHTIEVRKNDEAECLPGSRIVDLDVAGRNVPDDTVKRGGGLCRRRKQRGRCRDAAE